MNFIKSIGLAIAVMIAAPVALLWGLIVMIKDIFEEIEEGHKARREIASRAYEQVVTGKRVDVLA